MSSKIHEFDPQIYPRKLWVLKGNDEKYIKETFSCYDGKEIQTDDSNYECYVVHAKRKSDKMLGELVVICCNNLSVATIFHEAVHVATDIFGDINSFLAPNNQEPFAYLVGWVANCINQVRTGKIKE